MSSPDLIGQVAIVTGASQGIGEAIAEALAAAGAEVIGLSRSGRAPKGVEGKVCDISDHDAVGLVIAQALAGRPALHILINAAGVSFGRQAGDNAEIARFCRTIEVNLLGVYACILAARPFLKASGAGSIVNITSINAVRGFPGNPGYVAAKAGLSGLTRALATDFSADGIRVNAVAPGYVHTAMTANSFADPLRRAARARQTLLSRWGEAREIAAVVGFLASPAASYITGQEIFVDGGWTAQGLAREEGE